MKVLQITAGIAAISVPLWYYYPLAAKIFAGGSIAFFASTYFALRKMTRGNVRKLEKPKPTYSRAELEKATAGKRVLIVGGTSGLGAAIANHLTSMKAKVTVVGRRKPSFPVHKSIQADLSLVSAQKAFVDGLNAKDYDLVLFTQGIITSPTRTVTSEGLEIDLAISFVGRFVISQKLISKGYTGPIFIMSFPGAEEQLKDINAEESYDAWKQHMNTVVANDSLILYLAKKFPKINVAGLNPGLIATDIRGGVYNGNVIVEKCVETLIAAITPTADDYAALIVPTLVSYMDGKAPAENGVFYNQTGEALQVSKFLSDSKNVDFVWNETQKCLAAKGLSI